MFMRTQFLASKFAHKFNVTLDELKKRLNEMSHQPVLDRASKARFRKHRDDVERYPRIQFVQPQVFELVDKNERKTYNVLVEPMIAGKYKKYNNNKGGLVDQKFESPYVELDDNLLNPSLVKMLLGTKPESKEIMLSGENQNVTKKAGAAPMELLSVIAEDEEESETECDDSGINAEEDRNPEESTKEIFERIVQEGSLADIQLPSQPIPDEDFMQAFSHFSYVRSGGRLIVVDLQGALNIRPNGSCKFVLTDPAIHKRNGAKALKGLKFGRTDRRDKGIEDFFATHICNDACRLMGLRPRGICFASCKPALSQVPGCD